MPIEKKQIKLRVVFMGTSDLSEKILEGLIEEKYNLVGVYTKIDKKIGRKQEMTSPKVKLLAEKHGLPVFQPKTFKSEEALKELHALKPDLIVVAAYGKVLPKSVLEIPGFGCINIHVSLLPKYRGPSPVQNALLNGETETGTTIMLMDEGIDTGDILSQRKLDIKPTDTTETLMIKLAEQGSQLFLETLPNWIERKIKPTKQNHFHASLCQLIEREDGHIFWIKDAQSIYNRYRALTPWPGIFTYWKNGSSIIRLKLISIDFQKGNSDQKKANGEVFQTNWDIGVQTAKGVIFIKELQKEGKKTTDIKSFVNGHPSFIGSILF
ncbi:MAG: methionyl-tRNA formyltransferase [Candidatus Moranbacteria bacterium]|nr:methionyl-tRNA formyltransferase [Candidatus Moranbacteria bacterium]